MARAIRNVVIACAALAFACDATAAAATAPSVTPPPLEALRGTVGTAAVLMRVELKGESVQGRYFYEKYGRDILVEGVLHDGHLSLHTKNEKFEGMRGADGSITGVWTRDAKSFPFRLEPIARDGNVRVYVKRFHEVKHGKRVDTVDEQAHAVGARTTCTRDAKGAEIFGLVNVTVEAKLNVLLAPTFAESNDCEGDSDEEQDHSVVLRAGRWATLTDSESAMFEGAAHPSSGRRRSTYDLRTGRTAGEGIKLKREVDDAFLKQNCTLEEDVDLQIYKERRFIAGESGITLTPTRTCEADRNVEYGSYDCELSYAALLKAGYLDPASPWAELWSGAGAVTAGAVPVKKPAVKHRAPKMPRTKH